MKSRTVVIIGGGVIGLSTAYQLALRKYGRIVLLEKGALGDGSSSRAAGIGTGLLWSETGVQARKISLRIFRELSGELPNYHYHNENGCLGLFAPADWPEREKLLPLYDRLGVGYRVLNATEILARWPDLHPAPEMIGLHDALGGYSEPPEYIAALAKRVRELGVDIRENTKVTGFLRDGARLTGVRTAAGDLPADAVVSTVHVWTLPFLEPLALSFPVKHFVHQRYLTTPGPKPWNFPPVNADPFGGYIRPAYGNRILLGMETAEREEWRVKSTDFTMPGLQPPPGLRDETVARFLPFLPALKDAVWESEKVGLISFSMDGEPILGPVKAVPGLFVGLAFHSGGFSYNPAAGFLLAEYVSEGRTSIDVAAFSPDRYSKAMAAEHLGTTVAQKDAVRRRH